MTTTWESAGDVQDGAGVTEVRDGDGDVTAPELDALERTYDEAMACIADMAGAWAPDTEDPWPETEEIDVRAIKPPEVSRRASTPQQATASPAREPRALARQVAARRPEAALRPWRRWFADRANRSLPAW